MVFEVNQRDYKKIQADKIDKQMKEAKKNKLLQSIMSREQDAFSSSFAISQLLAFYMQSVKKKSTFLNFGVMNMSNIVQAPHSIIKYFIERRKQCFKDSKEAELSDIRKSHSDFGNKLEGFLNNFDRLSNNKSALDELLKGFEQQFDNCHKLRHRARKWVEINRLNVVDKQDCYSDEFFKEFEYDDKENYNFVKKVLDIEKEMELGQDLDERVGSLGYLKDLVDKGVLENTKKLKEIIIDSLSGDSPKDIEVEEEGFVEDVNLLGKRNGNKKEVIDLNSNSGGSMEENPNKRLKTDPIEQMRQAAILRHQKAQNSISIDSTENAPKPVKNSLNSLKALRKEINHHNERVHLDGSSRLGDDEVEDVEDDHDAKQAKIRKTISRMKKGKLRRRSFL